MRFLIFSKDIKYFLNPAYFIVYISYLIRIFTLIDFTDEMQYYLQINELNNHNSFFHSDFFIQQLIYFVFYPFNKLYFLLNETSGLILFNRIILTILLLFLMFIAKKIFLDNGSSHSWANWTSALLCMMPSIGIYAISYNTISFIGLSFFLLMLSKDWHKGDMIYISLISIFTSIANPVIGILIFLISSFRLLIYKSKTLFFNYLLISSFLIFLIIFILFQSQLIDYSELIKSLGFSRGFGAGSAWKTQYYLWPIILVYIFGSFKILIKRKFSNFISSNSFKFIIFLSIICSFIIIISEILQFSFPILKENEFLLIRVSILYPLSLIVLFSQLILKITNKVKISFKNKQWIIIAILIFALGSSFTSGDGFAMLIHIFCISIPICLGFSGNEFSLKENY